MLATRGWSSMSRSSRPSGMPRSRPRARSSALAATIRRSWASSASAIARSAASFCAGSAGRGGARRCLARPARSATCATTAGSIGSGMTTGGARPRQSRPRITMVVAVDDLPLVLRPQLRARSRVLRPSSAGQLVGGVVDQAAGHRASGRLAQLDRVAGDERAVDLGDPGRQQRLAPDHHGLHGTLVEEQPALGRGRVGQPEQPAAAGALSRNGRCADVSPATARPPTPGRSR